MLADLGRGGLVIERLTATDQGRDIPVPDGMVHHWVGLAFIPGGTVAGAVGLLSDYERHDEVYAPAVQRAGCSSATATASASSCASSRRRSSPSPSTATTRRASRGSPTRAHSRIVSTRVQQVEDAGTERERVLAPGRDGGFLWRINSYWRFLERDGGVYVQCESVSLTRDIPFGLGWVVGPFVTSIPRESLTFTLETTRRALLGPR